jgi:putative mobilizable transposon, excision protein
MDFLSYLTLKQTGNEEVCINAPCDYLVMNSVNNLKKALVRLQAYPIIHCYLDNDLAGQKTTETIAGMYGLRVHDEAHRYTEYKDLNDYLRGKKR